MADNTTGEHLDQQLSALMDDECSDPEVGLALRRLTAQPELAERWRRYHLISDALGGHLPPTIDSGFADRISAAVAEEPTPAPQSMAPPVAAARRRPLVGWAAAAALVAGVTLLVTQWPTPQPAVPQLAATESAAADDRTAAVAAVTPAVDLETRDRLDHYLANHTEYASVNGVHGMLPYVHRVSYTTSGR